MTEKLATARRIRVGAERLRKLASSEADAKNVAEMIRIAREMDEHAAELERSIAQQPSRRAGAV